MEKIIYWLKKLGIFRSASYTVKGDASKLNEMQATDGGMIQDQKKIDAEYEEKVGEKNLKKEEKKKTSGLFWIFLILAIFFFLAYWGGGFSSGSFLAIFFWIIFLFYLKKGSVTWASSFVKVLMIGLVLTVISLVVIGEPDDKQQPVSDMKNGSSEKNIEEGSAEKCDDANSTHASFNKIEKVIVSKNPCEVPWILAQPVEKYELKTKKGTVLKVTVFNNYVNNVKAGESYTIRVLDVEEDITGQKDVNAGIAIVRWVPNKSSLKAAKKEVEEIVNNLNY